METTTDRFRPSDKVAEIRGRLTHPIIDGDGHCMEFLPQVRELIVSLSGEDVARRFDNRIATMFNWSDGFMPVRLFNGMPAENTLDRMTVALPELLYRRMPEFGLDFGLLYPSVGLMATIVPDDELRRVTARAFNLYYAEAYGPYRDRLEPVAVIPTFTPDEAIAELEHAVRTLGLKAVVMNGALPRVGKSGRSDATWIDTLGHDSLYDYDPLWAKCEELGVAATFHGMGLGWGTRTSNKNYVYNHLGQFAAAQEAVCRSLVMGGVPKRFPRLRFAFLEGGVTWAVQLYADLLGHFAKRNGTSVTMFDDRRIDHPLASKLFDEYARGRARSLRDEFEQSMTQLANRPPDGLSVDDFADSLITGPEDIVDMFTRQFNFGCEADDPLNALAFDTDLAPYGARLNAVFASDIGHWDVPDMRDVLSEAWELVEHGHLDEDEFHDFSFGNVAAMLTAQNPAFFDTTVVETEVRALNRRLGRQ